MTSRAVTPLLVTNERPPSLRSRSRVYALLVLSALNAFNHLDRQLLSVLLEPIRREFGLGDIQLGLLSGPVFAVVFALLSFPAAIWAVHRGRVNLIAAAAMVWGAMTVACGLARSFGALLLARLGVGIGEAGGAPAAQTLISDWYEPGTRTTAMSVFIAGLNAGVFLAFLVGGIVGQIFGWRTAFVSAGATTIVLAFILGLTVREPFRRSDGRASPVPRRSVAMVRETFRLVWSDVALRHLCIGATLTAAVGQGALAWLPSFLVRAHAMDIAQVGLYLAIIVGIGGAAVTWIGGVASDRLRARDLRWSLWFVALVLLATKPLSLGFYLVGGTSAALIVFVLPGVAGSIFLGPSFATLHDRVEPALRPIASAVLLGLVNLIGLGLGPLLVGVMSERLFAAAGPRSLAYALVVMQILGVWGIVHYYHAGRKLAAAPS